ncbi:type IX secretion system membrane protein PorP/SprF [Odoribacter sp. OttesenSCG-928-G04]|nr:type IX secretion system membrane protein PorP/SprF [Odoribacter sp. OttesenSCG-928-G04]MDL2331285.1 type IX secretion system membrane protein PorP/SprF [Odoribacter sp. OttesenSCG-928-A06]
MKKRLGIIVLTLLNVILAHAQYDVQLSQHMFNRLSYNPAVTGASQYLNINGNIRNQWHGWDGAPKAKTFSVHNFFNEIRSGIGVTVTQNEVGLENSFNIKLQYAYHVLLSPNSYLSLGLGGGVLHRYFDHSRAYSENIIDDRDILLGLKRKTFVDFDFGIEYNMRHFTVGLSVTHLTNPGKSNDIYEIKRHYYGFARYQAVLTESWMLEPAVFFQNVNHFLHSELSLVTYYKKLFWFGMAYRIDTKMYGEALVPVAGVKFGKYLHLGYSYDIYFGDLKKHTEGTHEVFIGIRIPKHTRKKGMYRSPRFVE